MNKNPYLCFKILSKDFGIFPNKKTKSNHTKKNN